MASGREQRRGPAVTLPAPADTASLALALAALSTSGPLIAATAAPAVAIAFWRNAIATGLLLPLSAARRRRELAGLSAAELRGTAVSGVLLGLHFAVWVPSVTLTTVASATALVATQPIWAALFATRAGYHVPRLAWVGIGVAVVGAAVVSGVDISLSTRAAAGDGLALAGAVFAAAYVTTGERVRRTVTTTVYTTGCYLVAALVLLAVTVGTGEHFTGYPVGAWARIAALVVGAQLLGHSTVNRVLRRAGATVVSLAILFEVPGASLIAGFALHQHPAAGAWPGLALLLAGIAVVVTAGRAPSVASAA